MIEKKIYEGVENKERSPTLKENASMIQDGNSHIRRTNNKRNRPMWQLGITIQCLIAENGAKYIPSVCYVIKLNSHTGRTNKIPSHPA